MKRVIIIGGGPAGLITAIRLARENIQATVIEKREYPFHRVCGEYISNEVMPFLRPAGLFPEEFSPPAIHRFQLSDTRGRSLHLPLDLGGFGISRYAFDHFLYKRAQQSGVRFILDTPVDAVLFSDDKFFVQAGDTRLEADVVVGAHGKRSKLDTTLNRPFTRRRSPFIGVKYHVRTDFPAHLIALHNFDGGYCGINTVENGVVNICYLAHREAVRNAGNLQAFEQEVMGKNKLLKSVFDHSEFLFEKPLTINEISFDTKGPVENHVLMTGDAAGMVAPLFGNGIAMAIHSGKLAGEAVARFCHGQLSRAELETYYAHEWNKNFRRRLWLGRQVQQLFGHRVASRLAVTTTRYIKPLARLMVRSSHGAPFE